MFSQSSHRWIICDVGSLWSSEEMMHLGKSSSPMQGKECDGGMWGGLGASSHKPQGDQTLTPSLSLSLSLSLPLSSNPLTACQATERWDPGHTQVLRWQHLVVMVAHLKCNSTLQADAEQSAHTEWTLNNFMKSFYPMGAFKKHTAVWAPHTPRSTFTGGHTLGPELERTLWHKLTGFGATEAPGFIRWFIIYLIVDRRLNRTNRGNQSWAVCNYWLESPGHVFLSWPVIHPSN